MQDSARNSLNEWFKKAAKHETKFLTQFHITDSILTHGKLKVGEKNTSLLMLKQEEVQNKRAIHVKLTALNNNNNFLFLTKEITIRMH